MIFTLFRLELKSILRSSQLKNNAFTFVIKCLLGLYLALILLSFGFLTIKLVDDYFPKQDQLVVISGFFIFYWLYDLLFRFMISSSPILSIKPLLILNIKRHYIVKYALFKAYFNVFNLLHLCYFIPLSLILVSKGYSVLSVTLWSLSLLILLSCNSFISVFLDKVNIFFYAFVGFVSIIGFAHFYEYINIFPIVSPIFYFFYQHSLAILLSILFLIFSIYLTYKYYFTQLYLDKGLKLDSEQVKTFNFNYLNSLGAVGAFIKNDIYLLIRNKRSRGTILMSLLFIFYPFLLVKFDEGLSGMVIFVAIFTSGGFMTAFGQYVPSWDSAHYALFMTQSVSYREYLLSKWYIIIFSCVITLLLCSFYFFISPLFYLALVAATVFNIGFNSNIVLLMGAYVNQPIDLANASGAFGDTKSFNINTLLLSLVVLFFPLLIYNVFQYFFTVYVGFLAVAIAGCVGFFLRDKIFNIIVKKYKKNKYKTLINFNN